ncbi:MAG: NUDIX hydrolase [Thiobacillus sp.]
MARFRDLRERYVDSNLFSYHLKLLIKNNFVKKVDGGYTLGDEGYRYVDRVSEANMNIRIQPKIITMLIWQNTNGQILLQKRIKQPYIDLWTLPNGKLHIEDSSIKSAVLREASEKVGIADIKPKHIGDCYMRVVSNGEIITSTLVHVFKVIDDRPNQNDNQVWAYYDELSNYQLAPSILEIITMTPGGDGFFFEEFTSTL